MKIKYKTYNSLEEAESYLGMVKHNYSHLHGFDLYLSDLKNALTFSITSPDQQCRCVNIYKEGSLLAHVGLIEDKRLSHGGAFFGFFETVRDKKVFTLLWEELLEFAQQRGVSSLMGPVNGSIWHQYRIVKEQTEHLPFISEPYSMPYYYDYLKAVKPAKEVNYYSGKRSGFEKIKSATKPSYDSINRKGITIEKLESINKKMIRSVLKFSKKVFNESWGYFDLNEDEFVQLYNKAKITKYVSSLYIIRCGSELIGYCTVLKDEDTIIMKTLAILPEWQRKGLGNAMVYKVHDDASDMGISNIIYALIREENKVKYFPKDDAEIIREYACFRYIL